MLGKRKEYTCIMAFVFKRFHGCQLFSCWEVKDHKSWEEGF